MRLILSSILLLSVIASEAQKTDYYLFPVRPNEQNFLAGTMGEMRGTHFHAGIDIKTGGVVGYPIYAAADGYVSRIKVSSTGYGNALYITHPNWETTVYAHLHEFRKDIADYVLKQQYKNESFSVNLFPGKDQFLVSKGEEIALGGNSGSSSGPHLHFEIRDANQNVLNPLNFGFDEIKDSKKPTISQLRLIPRSIETRIDGVYKKTTVKPSMVNNTYVIDKTLNLYGEIGFALLAHDKLDGAHNKNGIKYFELIKDGEVIFKHDINKLSFGSMSSIKQYMDYPEKYFRNLKVNKLFIDEGNELDIYDGSKKQGVCSIYDTLKHQFVIKAIDAHGNNSILKFSSKFRKEKALKDAPDQEWSIHQNIMKIAKPIAIKDSTIELMVKGVAHHLHPAYESSTHKVYLFDLDKGIPDYIDRCDDKGRIKTNLQGRLLPYAKNIVNHPSFRIIAEKNALFDTLYLRFEHYYAKDKELFNFQYPEYPTKKTITVNLISDSVRSDKEKHHVYSVNAKGRLSFVGGKWIDNQTISFRTKVLEQFTIASDSIPPTLNILTATPNQLRVKASDNLSGVRSVHATLNDEFVLLEHKRKLGYYQAIKKNKNIPFKGKFILTVTDQAGNRKIVKKIL